MSSELDRELASEMARWESAALRRRLGNGTSPAIAHGFDFTSNDYLGLARNERVVEAARAASAEHGAGARASRLLGGGSPLDAKAERAAAEWLGAESALLFASGYQANLGLVTALAARGDAIVSDERNHASLIDACRLSHAHVSIPRHVDLDDIEASLRTARRARRRFVLTESVFSMDGDAAPLAELHALCVEYDAWLIVDEAHAVGLIGPHGAGGWAKIDPEGSLARAATSRLCARIVTGGKALGVSGAFVVGSSTLREHLVNHARSFVYSTGVSPAVSGALCASIAIARADTALRERALTVARAVAEGLDSPRPAACIVSHVVGAARGALELERQLFDLGLCVRAVRPPTVPDGTARLRIACHSDAAPAAIEQLIGALRSSRAARAVNVEPRRIGTKSDSIGTASHSIGAMSSAGRTASSSVGVDPIFVVGTDTDVGKTVVSALLTRAAARRGSATYWKPVQTGADSDTREVERLAASKVTRFAEPTYAFPLAASPHQAAAAVGEAIDIERLTRHFASLCSESTRTTLIVELAGGLLVPYTDAETQADWLAALRPALVLVARSGLGTLNHTLLTFEALSARHLAPRALFLVGPLHAANRETLRRASGLDAIYEVPHFVTLDAATLDEWIGRRDFTSIFEGR